MPAPKVVTHSNPQPPLAPWLIAILDSALPNHTGRARDELAAAILDAIPVKAVSIAIAESAHQVLKTRAIRDGAGDIAREISNNAAQGVWAALVLGEA